MSTFLYITTELYGIYLFIFCNSKYCLDGIIKWRVNEVRDLGLLFDCNVSFSKHIECDVAKSFFMLGLMKRIKIDNFKILTYTLLSIYNSTQNILPSFGEQSGVRSKEVCKICFKKITFEESICTRTNRMYENCCRLLNMQDSLTQTRH